MKMLNNNSQNNFNKPSIGHILFLIGFVSIMSLNIACGKQSNYFVCDIKSNNENVKEIYSRFCEKISNPSFDLEKAKLRSKEMEKPILVIFNSIYCVDCRTVEDNLLFNSEIETYLNENFVIAVLFVDDNTSIGSKEADTSSIKKANTVGAVNSKRQKSLTMQGHNPSIIVLNSKGESTCNTYRGSKTSAKEFKDWLENCNGSS